MSITPSIIPELAICVSIFSFICVIILLKKLKNMDEPLIVFKKFIIIPGGEELGEKQHRFYKWAITLAIILLALVCIFGLWVANKALDTSNNIIVTQTQINNTSELEELEIDINLCTYEEFKSLKGVGETKARKFIDIREKIGEFESVYDLIEYDIIGENTLSQNIHKIKVGD